MATANWRDSWDGFPWRDDNADAERWRRGLTGEPFVDAAMREMYVTGTMHNRARMIAASYLTKHLMTDWRVGLDWFADCLTDWDPAANAMGWQWVAGSGPDAAPYFRIFNPAGQAEKFDLPGLTGIASSPKGSAIRIGMRWPIFRPCRNPGRLRRIGPIRSRLSRWQRAARVPWRPMRHERLEPERRFGNHHQKHRGGVIP